MKIKIRLFSFVTFTLLFVSIVFIGSSTKAQTLNETVGSVGVSNSINNRSATSAEAIRNRIRADLDIKVQNAKHNQETRNQMIEKGYKISSTSPKNPFPINKASSTNPIQKRELNNKLMQEKNFNERKEVLAKQLGVALKNLVELRKRIDSRIEKDRNSGKDMTNVNELLKIADSKIQIAKQSVEEVRNYKPSNKKLSSTTTDCLPVKKINENRELEDDNDSENDNNDDKRFQKWSTSTPRCLPSTMIDLEKIRSIVNKAQVSIKEAHKALTDVVVAIAKISGKNNPKNASSTPSSLLPNTTNSPTTSPSI